jgi:hypothetical protein
MSINTIAGVARAAMLVDLAISTYAGRKQDRKTQDEVTTAAGSGSKRAASVYKSLFADCKELDAIIKFQAKVRNEHYRLTLPWSDNGQRLLPTKSLMDYQANMTKCTTEFNRLVDAFLDKYDTLVAAAAFQLGTLFDRDEYPTRDQVARKFSMDTSFTPLPAAGDFRLDIESSVQQELIRQYEARAQAQLAQANQDSWTRLHTALSKMSDRLTVDEDGKKRVFHDTLVTNAEELCDLLTVMNVTNDPDLERARCKLVDALTGVTPKELREEDSTRLETKRKVDAILDSFDWMLSE